MKRAFERLEETPVSVTRERTLRRRSLRPITVGPYAPQLIRLVRQPSTLAGARPVRVQVREARERLGEFRT